MSKETVITAIDVGTDKCVTLIGAVAEESHQLRLAGVAAVPSRGMKKSVIVDLEAVLSSIEQSLNAAERMAGLSVTSAYLSVSGNHIRSKNSKGVVAVANPDQEITPEDVSRVIEAARAVSIPSEREIIHVIPRYFKVDSQDGIRDPVGMTGVRLESEAHIITGLSTSLKNLKKCVMDLGVTVEGFVFSGLAASQVTLTETEKELGVVALDIGAGTSSFCVYVDGALEYSGSLPIGARHITQDIAVGCRISLDNAEKLKIALSKQGEIRIKPRPGESKKDFTLRKKQEERIDLAQLGIDEKVDNLNRSGLIKGIMMPRMKEIVEMLGQQLVEQKLLTEIPVGVVLSGGGAETVGFPEVVKSVLRLPARIGYPADLAGLVGEVKAPTYATSVGLLYYAKKQGAGEQSGQGFDFSGLINNLKLGKAGKKLIDLIKSLLP
ncbi:MAG: cell division protein FtsA [Candidatus Pacebacteria bacterium]|nr:cell division protein FtsA [Candidatus Paceibacterota bacterium]